jgi:hypothetical protein
MKLIVINIAVLLITVFAHRAIAQDTTGINVSFRVMTLEKVLHQLTDDYQLKFSYSKDLVELHKEISVDVHGVTIDELLQQVFSKAGVEYLYIGDQIAVRQRSSPARNTLRGKVIDKRSGEPIAFASVRIGGTGQGTATNNDGLFVLNIPSQHGNGELIISHISYKNHVAPLLSLGEENVFQLEEYSTELQTVVVTTKRGSSIIEEAISRIRQNYDTSDVRYTYFVRDVSLLDDAPVGASETLYQAYRGSQAATAAAGQVKLLSGRRIRNFQAVQRILQTFIRWTGFELGITANVIFSADLNMLRDDNSFPSSKFMSQHQFDLLGISHHGGREVYIINFDQKPGIRKSLYKGRFFIDTETLAFLRIEIELSPQGIGQARFFNTPRAMAALFGYGKCAVTESKTIINYQPLKEKWYPATIEEYWSAALIQPKKQFYSNIVVKANVVVTDIQTDNVSPFDVNETLSVGEYKTWEYLYRSPSLQHFNTIETDVDIQQVFRTIADKNRSQGIDTKFWKRFQPYKRDPSLLVRDSLLCMQSVAMVQPATDRVADENNYRSPKYPSLNRSFYTKHFVLHYMLQDSVSALEVSGVLEANYEKVLREFELRNVEGSTHVEIYPNIDHYHFAIGNVDAPDSDVGMAVDLNLFRIVSPGNPGTYHTRESLLKGAVHEFAHCVHYHFIEYIDNEAHERITDGKEAPWLFEAVASYIAGQFYNPARFEYMTKQQYPTIQVLNDVENSGRIYDLGYVIIDFIKQKWGQKGLTTLLQKNGNIQGSFNISEREFETELYRYINARYLTDQK